MRHAIFGSLAFSVFFVVNPAFLLSGCGQQFSEQDAVAVVATAGAHRTYGFTVGDSSYEVLIDVVQSAKPLAALNVDLIAVAHACSDRTFVRSASACIDITRIPVEGTLTIKQVGVASDTQPILVASVKGELEEGGTTLGSSSLVLSSDDGTAVFVSSNDARTFFLQRVQTAKLNWNRSPPT